MCLGKVVGLAMENEATIREYETLTSDLLQWIEKTIIALGDRQFANSLTGMQQLLLQFNNYRTVEKPPRYSQIYRVVCLVLPEKKCKEGRLKRNDSLRCGDTERETYLIERK